MRYILVCLVIITAISGMMIPGLKPPLNLTDEAAHTLTFLFTTLAILQIREIPPYLAAGVMFLAAFLLEAAQFLVPARSPEILDVMFNLSGVVVGVMIAVTITSTREFLSRN